MKKEKKWRNKAGEENENAYFTLEASLIMPLVFMIIILMMYMGFYQYDKCVLQQDVFRMMIRGSQQKSLSNEELVQHMRMEEGGWNYEKYILCDWGNKNIEVTHREIRIAQEASFAVKLPLLAEADKVGFLKIGVDFSGERIHPEETIRRCRKLQQLSERGKNSEGMGIYSSNE